MDFVEVLHYNCGYKIKMKYSFPNHQKFYLYHYFLLDYMLISFKLIEIFSCYSCCFYGIMVNWREMVLNNILLTNLLYYDYKYLCFINLLTGHYRIYGALIQDIMEKSGPLRKKWHQILTRSLEFCFFRFWLKNRHLKKNR